MQLSRFVTLVVITTQFFPSFNAKKIHLQKDKDESWRYVGVWGSWSTWSECSRSCGGGVSVQTRSCRNQLLHHKKYLRFKQIPVANKTQSKCVGIYIRHQLCNPKQCSGKLPSEFRKEQCAAFDDTYKWEPFYQHDSPCALNCKAIGYRFYATLAQKVVDGTPCDFHGPLSKICVGGVCKPVGCDGLIGSDKFLDHCGVCGGNNTTCRIISGIFTKPQMTPGYNLITTIPQGACNINITELKPTKNYLALRQVSGNYIINGNWALNWPGDYPAVGTSFAYQRHDQSNSEVESITAKGPITRPLEILLIYKQLNPGIKYQYTIPLRNSVAKPVNDVIDKLAAPLSDTPTQFSNGNVITKPPLPPLPRGKVNRGRKRHYKWQINGFSECSQSCAGGTQSTIVSCVKESNSVTVPDVYCKNIPKTQIRTVSCNTQPCPPEWVPEEWSECSVTCGQGEQHRQINCKQQISRAVQVSVPESSCTGIKNGVTRQRCQVMSCTTWRVGRWSQCSTSCGKGIRSRQVHCVSRDEKNLPDDHCLHEERPDAEEVCDLGSCSKAWFFTEWSSHQCDGGCSSGIQVRKTFCPVSDEDTCQLKSRPDETKPCPPIDSTKCAGKWFIGPWTSCSVSCGKGVQSRDVICVAYIRGQYRTVLDFQCSGTEKPIQEQPCHQQECGSEWYFTEWTECSMPCDSGSQNRQVRCLSERQKTSLTCSPDSRPNSHQQCNTHECHHNTNQKDSGCVDKFRNCHLVAQARLCSYNYYRDACCHSCARFT